MRLIDGTTGRMMAYGVLAVAAAEALFPLGLAVLNAVKTTAEITANPLALPIAIRWDNFANAWRHAHLDAALLNTVLVTAMTVVLVCATAAPLAYVLARRRIPGWRLLSFYMLASTTVPIQLFLYPLYFAFARLGLISSLPAVAVIYAALYTPFAVFLLRTYVLAIPEALEEAARIDGASSWQNFRHVVLPLLSPGLLTVAIITAMHTWNEFVIAVTFLQAREKLTAVASFYSLTGQYTSDWGEIMAAAVLVVLPMVVAFVALQRRFIDGMAAGSVKG